MRTISAQTTTFTTTDRGFTTGKSSFTYTYSLAERSAALDAKAENINETAAKHPELEFFVYYIEKDTDIDMISGVKPGLSDYFLPQINIPEENKGCFRVDSFDVFDKYFYDTDHHWNYNGSYLGYTQVLSMISGDEAIKPDGVYHSGQFFPEARHSVWAISLRTKCRSTDLTIPQ